MIAPTSATLLSLLDRHLRQNAGVYYPELAGHAVSVKLVRRRERSLSWLFDFDLSSGRLQRGVVAKALSPRLARARKPVASRPTLGTWCEPEKRVRFEYDILAAIESHFTALDDPRFATIHMLETIPEQLTILMDRSTYVTLRSVLLRNPLGRRGKVRADLLAAFRHTGAWLREYHRMPRIAHARPHRTERDDFVRSVHALGEYLDDGREGGRFSSIAGEIEALALDRLPARLPLAMGHGDFAPRNMLVGPTGRVIGFDTMGRWMVPFYQDIAHFITALKLVGPQILSQGGLFDTEILARYEREFLDAYFDGEAVPRVEIGLFETEAVLDKLAAAAQTHRCARGPRRVVKRLELALRNRYLLRHLHALLKQIHSAPRTS